MEKEINTARLKNFAQKELKSYPLVYSYIMEGNEKISVDDFLSKIRTWLWLLDKDIERRLV